MADIMHQVAINAASKEIYALIATKDGLQKWLRPEDGWKINGDQRLGGVLTFHYGEGSHQMKVVILDRDKQVRWACITGSPEWLETTVDFFIEDNVKKCVLQFAHNGWREQTKFFYECDKVWAGCVADIKKLAEGEGR
ncbi:MAG: SRPBCC domain-containing protein [Chitinophagaceae bacterium]|nr:MAG: SRPBCC domain-containing protein [Chitinophagaceae bacterium]